jgi:hypothetical protein
MRKHGGVSSGVFARAFGCLPSAVELADGVQHGDDVGDGRERLDVVGDVEDEAAAGGEDFAAAQGLDARGR